MKRPAMMILLISIVLAAGLGAFFVTRSSDEAANTTSTATEQPVQETAESRQNLEEQQATAEATPALTVTYSDDGFEPRTSKIKAGETVEVRNTSSRGLDFASDPHPVHTDNRELNASMIAPGTSKKFKISSKGDWGFHNHLDASETGTITVE